MKQVLKSCLIALLAVSLTGCWDVQDITDRAYVTAIGFDQAQEGTTDDLKISFEIVLPNLFRQQEEKASFVQTVEAPSVGAAIEQLQTRISREISLAHVRVILFGEDLARKKNFLDIADFFQRNPYIQMRIQFLVVQGGQAKDVLNLDPVYGKYVAKELVSMSELKNALVRPNPFFDFSAQLRAHGGTGLAARTLASAETDMIARHGIGVYKAWHLSEWLSSEETRNANWLLEGEHFIVDARDGKSIYTYMVDSKSLKVTPIEDNGELRFEVQIKTAGPLMQEQGDHIDATNPKVIQKLETLFSKEIKSQVESAITKAQQDIGADYLRFDDALKSTNQKKYEQLDWKQLFPTLPITVEVDAKITRSGLSR